MESRQELFALDDTTLTTREQEVVLWNAHGKSNPEIAHILGISPETVKVHVRNACSKINVYNRTALVTESFRRGILRFTAVVLLIVAQGAADAGSNLELRVFRSPRSRLTRNTGRGRHNRLFDRLPEELFV